MTSPFPALIDALIAASSAALPDVNVADAWPNGIMSGDWLMFGVSDPEMNRMVGASATQTYPHATRPARDESCELAAAIFCAHGDDDAKGARDAAFAIKAAVAGLLRADVTLGVPGVWKTNLSAWRYLPRRFSDYGSAVVELELTITYEARI